MHVRSPAPQTLTAVDHVGERPRWLRTKGHGGKVSPGPVIESETEPTQVLQSPVQEPPVSRVRGRWRTAADRLLGFAWPPPPWQSLLAVASGLMLLGGLGLAVGAYRGSAMPVQLVALGGALTIGFLPAGLVAVHRRPRRLSSLLIAMIGLLALLSLASSAWSGLLVGAWFAHWTWWPPIGLLAVLLLSYPIAPASGRARGWLDVAAFAAAAGTGCLMDAAAVSPNADLLEESRRIGLAATILTIGWLIAALVTAGCVVGAVISILVRGLRGGPPARHWSVAVLPALVLAPVGYLLTRQGIPLAYLLPVPVLGVGLAAGLLPDPEGRGDRWWRHGVTAVLSVAMLYWLGSAVAAWLPGLVAAYPWLLPTCGVVLVAAVVGMSAHVWWPRVGALVARIRYGVAAEPFELLRDTPPQPPSTPSVVEITQALAAALRLPGVRIRAELGTGLVTVAQTGECVEPLSTYPIQDGRHLLGVLEVRPSDAGGEFDEHETATMRRAARRAAAAVIEGRTIWEATHARSAIVAQREEDRRRVRESLQDTFLPALSECKGRLAQARLRMPSHRTAALLEPVIAELVTISSAVSTLMDELRPDVLEQGLSAAITELARWHLPAASVRIDLGDAASLPASVEVAAYRIVRAALVQATGRATMRTVSVRALARPGQGLDLTVVDDGAGSVDDGAFGGELSAMRTWAEEVGGRLTVLSSQTGTRVAATLPLT